MSRVTSQRASRRTALRRLLRERRSRAPGVGRSRPVRRDRLPISEFAFDRAGAASPFGDDLSFPLETERLRYAHPPEAA
jgi:hypothetical protein